MSRRKKGNPVHGWLVLDKPLAMTSTRAVGAIKRLFDAQKAGHAGTLDPLATGILPIGLGEATKTMAFAVNGEKVYRFSVRWGAETSTDDGEGTVVSESPSRPTLEAIEALLPAFIGEIMQVPPRFSAVRVDGERAYDLARDGEEVELAARPVTIESLDVVEAPDASTTVFETHCGKGTYVRALARDMGRALGCFGHVAALRRARVGPFGEAEAVSLETVEAAAAAAAEDGGARLRALLKPVEAPLGDLPELSLSLSDAACLARGQSVLMRGRDAALMTGPVYAVAKGRLVALAEVSRGTIHPTRVFNFSD